MDNAIGTGQMETPFGALTNPAAQNEARALYAATAMLMAEGREKGLHYFALHLRVAMLELEPLIGDVEPMPPAHMPKARRQKIRLSDEMKRFIAGSVAGQ